MHGGGRRLLREQVIHPRLDPLYDAKCRREFRDNRRRQLRALRREHLLHLHAQLREERLDVLPHRVEQRGPDRLQEHTEVNGGRRRGGGCLSNVCCQCFAESGQLFALTLERLAVELLLFLKLRRKRSISNM